jgi:hypothetical protein
MERRLCSRRDPLPAIVFAGVLGLYWFTSARSPGWLDATLLLDTVRRLELNEKATTHNLFVLLGHAWLAVTPFLDPHRALTLLCALLGSLTVLLVQLAARELTGNRTAAALAAAALALSQSLWWHSTMIEAYTVNTVLIAALLAFVFAFARRGGAWRLYGAFFAFGLGVSNHVLVGLYVFAFGVLLVLLVVRKRITAWHAPLLIVCAAAGASLFLFLLLRSAIERGSLLAALDVATGGGFRSMMFPRGLAARQRLFWRLNYVFLLLWNFPSAAVVFAGLGLPRLWRTWPDRTAALFFLVGLAAQVAWSANYLIWDMYAFALPVYVMIALPLASGIDGFLRRGVRRGRWAVLATFALPLALYPSFARLPGRECTIDRYISLYPESVWLCGFWDPADYVFNPIRRWDDGVERFAAGWIARLPPGAQYWDDQSKAAFPLQFYYQAIRGERPDVTVHTVDARLESDDARLMAEEIGRQLEEGDPVFISSLVEPERKILNALYHLEAPEVPLATIRSLEARDLVLSFPRTRILEFPLQDDRSFVIYRLERQDRALTR